MNKKFLYQMLLIVVFFLGCTDQRPEREFEARVDQVLADSWNYYKRHYIQADGRVRRPDNGNDTVSEGQAYALLRAVWSGDQATFERCYHWAAENLSQKKLITPHPGPLPSKGEGTWFKPPPA